MFASKLISFLLTSAADETKNMTEFLKYAIGTFGGAIAGVATWDYLFNRELACVRTRV
jgi:hypothetical protein